LLHGFRHEACYEESGTSCARMSGKD